VLNQVFDLQKGLLGEDTSLYIIFGDSAYFYSKILVAYLMYQFNYLYFILLDCGLFTGEKS